MVFFTTLASRPLKFWTVTELVQEVQRLDTQLAKQEQAAASHTTIDQAMGVVIALGQIPPEEAWRALRDVSQRTNTKVRIIAEQVLAFAQGGDLPTTVRTELQRAVVRYGGTVRGPLR